MTPYETSLYIKDYQEKYRAEQKDKVILAYLQSLWTAQWFGKRKPDKLDKILGTKKEQKKMSPEDILGQIKKVNQSLGGNVY